MEKLTKNRIYNKDAQNEINMDFAKRIYVLPTFNLTEVERSKNAGIFFNIWIYFPVKRNSMKNS